MGNFRGWKIIVFLVLVVMILGLSLSLFSHLELPYLKWFEDGVYNLVTPLLDYLTGIYKSAESYWLGITQVKSLIEENRQLKEEVYQLRRDKDFLAELSNENKRLRQLLAFKELVPYKSIGARVIGYSPANYERRIIINRGSKDGLEPKMPVIGYNGFLVGKIEEVGLSSSTVVLVNSPEFVVGGIVQRDQSRAIGLVRGQLNDPDYNLMDNISWNQESQEGDIQVGDIIVTSGLSNSYPKGLPIGQVTSIEKDNYGLSRKAQIKLFMSLHTIEEVLVITDF